MTTSFGAVASIIARVLINIAASLLVAIALELIISWRRGDYR
jgi:hypothetical protein